MRGMREYQPHGGPLGIGAGTYGGGSRHGGSALYPFERQLVSAQFNDQDDRLFENGGFYDAQMDVAWCISLVFRHDTDTECLLVRARRGADDAAGWNFYAESSRFRVEVYSGGGVLIKSWLFGAEVIGAWTQIAAVWDDVTDVLLVYQDGVDVTAGANKAGADTTGSVSSHAQLFRVSDTTGGLDDAQIDFQGLMYEFQVIAGSDSFDYTGMPAAIWNGGDIVNSNYHNSADVKGAGLSQWWYRFGFQSVLKASVSPWENLGEGTGPDLNLTAVGMGASSIVADWPGRAGPL